MCEIIGVAETISRRSLLKRAGLTAGAAAGLAAMPAAASAEGRSHLSNGGPLAGDASRYNTRLVLLGTAGGPTWWTGTERSGIASAVVVGDAVYLVDCGDGVGHRYEQAGLFTATVPPNDFTHLRGIFLTHLHSDHIVDFPALMLFGFPGGGLGTPTRPVQAFGPGRRGVLPAVYPPSRPVPTPVGGDNPFPGTVDMTELLIRAFATDINDRIRDTAAPDIGTRLVARDIPLPPGAGADPNTVHSPHLAEPIAVYEDDRVRVTATLVDHGQVFPSFGYRFDTDDGSITFSGDTTVCDNLVSLAHETDILVHEVVDPQWVQDTFAGAPLPPDVKAAYIQHLLDAHTTIPQVGPVAQAAGAKSLVLSHCAPANNPRGRWRPAGNGYSGEFHIGEDLMQFGVGKRVR